MNREIKFRAWYGGAGYGNIKPHMLYDEKPGDCLVWLNQGQDIIGIMQYTGLKDRNGKEIYEGDVVRDKKGTIEQVIYGDLAYRVKGKEGIYFKYNLYDCEVIGTIYENPELLEATHAS